MTEREMARKKAAARRARARKQRTRRVALTIALMLVVCVASVGGTIAWLTDTTTEVKNVFTPSTIGIDLTEENPADRTEKMVPGITITKDPKVTIKAGSEKSWVFVQITKSNNYDNFMENYEVADGWTKLEGTDVPDSVYFRVQDATIGNKTEGTGEDAVVSDVDVSHYILKDNQVKVKKTVTKTDMDNLKTAGETSYPTLSFTAYAIQYSSFEPTADSNNAAAALEAWKTLNPASGGDNSSSEGGSGGE